MPARRRPLLTALPLLLALPARAQDQPLRILSAGAVEPGLRPALDAFRAESGTGVELAFATAPQIRRRVQDGEVPDVLIAPPAVIADLAQRLGEARVRLGQVGVGIAVRRDAPDPGIRDAATLRRVLLAADSVVFNRASTGLYVEALFARLGIAEPLASRITRYDDGAAVLRHVARGRGEGEIAFAPLTEIILAAREYPVRLARPLPGEVQSHTLYIAAPLRASVVRARPLLGWLAGGRARAIFMAAGIEPAP